MSRLHHSLDEVTSKFNKKIKTVRELILLKAAAEGEQSPLLSNENMFFGRLKEFEVALTVIEKTLSESKDHLDVEHALLKKTKEIKECLEKQKKYLNHIKDNLPPQYIDSFLKIQKQRVDSKSRSQRIISRLNTPRVNTPKALKSQVKNSPFPNTNNRFSTQKFATFSANSTPSPMPKISSNKTISKSVSSSTLSDQSILPRGIPKHLTAGSGIRPQTPQRKIIINTRGSKLRKPARSYFDEPK